MQWLMTDREIRENPDKWLAWRLQVITASDAAAIAGIHNCQGKRKCDCDTPSTVYWRKMTGDAREQTFQMRAGLHWEALIAQVFAEEHEDLDVRPGGFCAHDGLPWMACTFDRLCYPRFGRGQVEPMEMKTTTKPWLLGDPPYGTLPNGWIVQDLWQMAIAGARRLHQAVLVLPFGPPKWYLVDWDADAAADVAMLTHEAGEFRDRHLRRGVPPPADANPATTEALKRIWRGVKDEQVQVTARQRDGLLAARDAIDRAEASEARWMNEILERLGDAREAVDAQGRTVVTRSASWPRKLNRRRLRLFAGPDVIDKCYDRRPEDDPVITVRVPLTRDKLRDEK
jgi:predicted phage-related endonuclease